jgi:protein involved in polysaccharide export with SLBB domain
MGLIVILAASLATAGCGKTTLISWYTWLDPTANIAAGDQSDVVPVVTQVDPLEDVHEVLPNSEPPTAEDLSWTEDDYMIGPRDLLTIQIKDLYIEGQLQPLEREVSDDGCIMLPEIPDRVKVSEMTLDQVRQAIMRAYRAREYLRDPSVNVQVTTRQQSYYNIIGAVARPSTYPIRVREFRLIDALAQAGDVNLLNVPYVYVVRQTPAGRKLRRPGQTPLPVVQTVEQLTPAPQGQTGTGGAAAPSSGDEELLQTLKQFMPGAAPATSPATPESAPSSAPAAAAPIAAAPAAALPAPVSAVGSAASPSASVQKELEALKSPLPPATGSPATQPIKPDIIHLAEASGSPEGGTAHKAHVASGEWKFINEQWVLVPASPPAQPSAATSDPATVATTGAAAAEAAPAGVASAPTADTMPVGTSGQKLGFAGLPTGPSGESASQATPAQKTPLIEKPAVAAQTPTSAPVEPAMAYQPDSEDPYNWAVANGGNLVRVIVIDLKMLKDADPRQNIVIHDRDTVLVPLPDYGNFYVMGEVNRPGEFPINGHRITVKMALATAGGFGPLAWPSNALLIRRLSHGQELRKPIRLDRIIQGKDPDILIEPDDVIAVGTHISASFLAVLRGSFRSTYGFGFVYDRNFEEKNYGQVQGLEQVFFK